MEETYRYCDYPITSVNTDLTTGLGILKVQRDCGRWSSHKYISEGMAVWRGRCAQHVKILSTKHCTIEKIEEEEK